jgi:hypothetical protein
MAQENTLIAFVEAVDEMTDRTNEPERQKVEAGTHRVRKKMTPH